MENWKIQLVMMTFCVLVQTSQGSSSSTEEERRLSRHWQHQSVESAMTIPVESLMKRSKALRFYGLMGKREGKYCILVGNKGETFVGLMERSVTNEGEPLKTSKTIVQNIMAAFF
uniref:Uncharacterized protein n=1 Tax=Fundulus heteroclitus TaxID=8078 RepID=A0A3Q2PWA5_FUNHE